VWVPDDTVADDDGVVRREMLWAALDCPGAWALPSLPSSDRPVVLGRLAVTVDRVPRVGEQIVVTGRHERSDGRKHYATTGLTDADGRVIASGRSTLTSRPSSSWRTRTVD